MEAIKPEDLHKEIGKSQSTSWFVVNQEMINNNMATLLEFSKKDLSPETMKKLIQEGTISKNAFEESDNKIILFLGKKFSIPL